MDTVSLQGYLNNDFCERSRSQGHFISKHTDRQQYFENYLSDQIDIPITDCFGTFTVFSSSAYPFFRGKQTVWSQDRKGQHCLTSSRGRDIGSYDVLVTVRC